jgi:hypothetical protein
MSVNPGQIYSFCGSIRGTEVLNNINLNGGTIRICANAQINGTFNSGLIVVACGATLTFPNGFLFNNGVGIVNYGTVVVNGDLNMQNNNNIFYNANPHSRLIVSGNLNFAQNSNQTGYFRNVGYVEVGGDLNFLEGGRLCLMDASIITCNNFKYSLNCSSNNNFRIQYGGVAEPGIIWIRTSANIRNTVTQHNKVRFELGTGATTSLTSCGSWGSATVVANAPAYTTPAAPIPTICDPQNCYTLNVLPVELLSFDLHAENGKVAIDWVTQKEQNMEKYILEKAGIEEEWTILSELQALGTTDENPYQKYRIWDSQPGNGMVLYRLRQVEKDGTYQYSDIERILAQPTANQGQVVFPNPSTHSVSVSSDHDLGFLQILNVNGQVVSSQTLPADSYAATISLDGLPSGLYFLQTAAGITKIQKTLE